MSDDAARMRQQRQLFDALDQAISETNRETIHGIVPHLNKAILIKMARTVAHARVKYIAAALHMAETDPLTAAQMTQLQQLRQAFEECRAAFDATKRAVSRGYIDIVEG